jgi:methyl-accepting chemotaxis protein
MKGKSEAENPKLKFRIRTKILLAFLGLSLVSLALFGYVALSNIRSVGDYALEKSASLGESAANDATNALEALGAEIIEQKAKDVARQCAIYINAHPDMAIADLQTSLEFQEIAVQAVGETGYTALTDYETLTCRFHVNPGIIDLDLHELAQKLPGFWEIMEGSQGGKDSFGYYDWEESDGSIREKYMFITPINARTADGVGMTVAATTYIDEFSKPVEETKEKIANTTLSVNEHINAEISNTRYTFIVVLMAIILVVTAVSFLLSRAITNPIMALTQAAQSIERGERFEPESITSLTKARDELARLARVFGEMAIEVQAREEHLKRQVEELRIKIDKVKKAKQVAEITETEYFQHLREHAKEMRERTKG